MPKSSVSRAVHAKVKTHGAYENNGRDESNYEDCLKCLDSFGIHFRFLGEEVKI